MSCHFPYIQTEAFIPSLARLRHMGPTVQTVWAAGFACGLLCTWQSRLHGGWMPLWAPDDHVSRSAETTYGYLALRLFLFFFLVMFLHLVLCLIKKITTVSQFFSELEHPMNITCFGDLSCSHFCHSITGILCVNNTLIILGIYTWRISFIWDFRVLKS